MDATQIYATFVNAAYRDALGRTADSAALTFWTQPSELWAMRISFGGTLTHSDEFYANLVRQQYQQALGRQPEAEALAFWTVQLQQGVSDQQFQSALLVSSEFAARTGGDDSSWLNAAYQQILNRPLDSAGAAFWGRLLASGASRFDVAYAIASGVERARLEVVDDFQHYLGRAADVATLAYFVDQLTTTLTDEDFIAELIKTDEYFERQTGVSPTVVPVASPPDQALNPAIAAQLQQLRPNLLFLGDSLVWAWQNTGLATWNRFYAPRNSLNAGVPGDSTQNLLWRLGQFNFAGVQPKLAIVEIGTNNLGLDFTAEIAAGVAADVDKLRQQSPSTKILLLGIFPRGLSPGDPLRQNSTQANLMISRIADNQSVFYLDLSATFLRPDGTLDAHLFQPDLVHLTEQGYEAWAAAMENQVATLLAS